MFRSGADGPLDYERLLLNTMQGVRRTPDENVAPQAEINDFKQWKTMVATFRKHPEMLKNVALHLEKLARYDRYSDKEDDPNEITEHDAYVFYLKFLTGEFHYNKRGRKTEWIRAISALHHRRFVWGEQESVEDVRALLKRLEWLHILDTEHCHLSGVPIDADSVVKVRTRVVGLREELPYLRIHPVLGRRVAELRYKRQLTCTVTGMTYEGSVDFLNPHAGVPFDLLPVSPHFVRELSVLDTTFDTFGIELADWVENFRSPRMEYVGSGRVD